ncbi:MAG: hypothetical protein KHX03_00350 [Clostridium sp.]|nr:hypothetical protein [Clostridium sp.]
MRIFLISIILFLATPVFASHQYLEKEYQNQWCKANKGLTEVTLPDSVRVDCVTDEYAIEFDFAYKWAESIGQSLYYSHCTGKKAGVVLIMEKPQKDMKYFERLNAVAKKYNIKVWTMTPCDMIDKKKTCEK